MARPLRIDVEGGWYHVMSRGIERRPIFPDDSFCLHFLDLLGEMTARFGVEVHAYVLMVKHYRLLLRTPGANASQAMQWLNVSYSAWSNAKRQRVGHVFQGRFCSTLIDSDGAWLLKASAYLHLYPVRVSSLGLGKAANKAESLGRVKGEAFADFRDRYGDWGLAMVLYLARRRSGLTLSRIGDLAGGMAYKTVFAQIKRIEKKLTKDSALRAIREKCQKEMSNVET